MKRIALHALGLSALAILAACGGDRTDSVSAGTASANGVASIDKGLSIQPDGSAQTSTATIDSRLKSASGKVDVWVALDQDSLARTRALLTSSTGVSRARALAARGGEAGVRRTEPAAITATMNSQRAAIRAQQAAAAQRMAGLGAVELGRVSVAHNAIAVRVDASALKQLAAMPGVSSVRPVVDYKLFLSETVPYVGGTAVQNAGFDGSGVVVAVLDSGIDFTHKNLGGTGVVADYNTCYAQNAVAPSGACASYFGPTAPKVIGGYDFVGEAWPNGAVAPDPNPIALSSTGGHGTHVADIIAGKSADGTHKGMAPGAKILAIKVCSAVASSCNGVALLQGVDFALDPNGDGNLSDAADVMNLSLGSDYGQIEDDLTQALTNAVNLGVSVVASAGNGSNMPYKVGSPSIAPGVISVAQTQVPSAKNIALVINSPAAIAGTVTNTNTIDWAPITGAFSGQVILASTASGTSSNLACAPLPAGSMTGKVALIDRGTCSISWKVDHAADAGAIGVLIANNVAGDPPSFSFDGTSSSTNPFDPAPTLILTQADGNRIKANAGAPVTVTVSPAVFTSLVGSMASTSSRGPRISTQGIKPEIGAPGASVSAEVGTGDGQTAFGGTSGAAPMVAGAAALMLQAHPTRSALQIKAMLMNSAETAIYTNPATLPGQLAPITRIGAGELRVNRAFALTGAVWDTSALTAALSFGAVEASQQRVLTRTLTVQNFSGAAKQYSISSGFRYANDQASGAVQVQAPATVDVPANGSATFDVTLVINPLTLPTWTLNGGSQGGNGALLNTPEYDGYVTLVAGGETLSVPWHVLPRKAADTSAAYSATRGTSTLTLTNTGADAGAYDLFSLIGSSAQLPASVQPNPGDNYAVVDLRSVGVRYIADCTGPSVGCLQFAISTYGRRAHPLYPGGFEIDVDTNGDGTPDYYIFQSENGGFGVSGQSVVNVQNAVTGVTNVAFFNDADLNSGNLIFTVLMSQLGNPSTSATMTLDAYAYDDYFTGNVTDFIGGMKFTPSAPRYSSGTLSGSVARGTASRITFTKSATVPASQSSELGLLMMYRRNAGNESQEFRP